MYAIAIIIARNCVAPTFGKSFDRHNYEVTDNGGGRIEVRHWLPQGNDPWAKLDRVQVVDATNPLEEADLIEFHRNWNGPKWVANKVESIASQHRRIISAEPAWNGRCG